jgi:hypothetical protein
VAAQRGNTACWNENGRGSMDGKILEEWAGSGSPLKGRTSKDLTGGCDTTVTGTGSTQEQDKSPGGPTGGEIRRACGLLLG